MGLSLIRTGLSSGGIGYKPALAMLTSSLLQPCYIQQPWYLLLITVI